eukprot:scaffold42595_cov19-Tisochrysis_lutea.AAC.3
MDAVQPPAPCVQMGLAYLERLGSCGGGQGEEGRQQQDNPRLNRPHPSPSHLSFVPATVASTSAEGWTSVNSATTDKHA